MESQDTFIQLQEQLAASRLRDEPTGDERTTEEKLEKIVADLAKQAGFEVRAMLGIGGMGAVVRAADQKLNREVALKFLPPQMVKEPARIAELRAEAEIVSRIKHENVVSILSWHEEQDVPFYAMELVDGESLMGLIRRSGKLGVSEAMRIMIEAAAGVEALHGYDIIHRDIKPQNILIERNGRVKITDFGIARSSEDSIGEARDNKIAGTPQFMAPEQARGEAASKQSDIYGIAATLYYCLTGKPPVKSSSDIRKQVKIVAEGKPIPIRNHLPKLNSEIAKVIMKGLNPVQAKRGWDMASYRRELEAAYISQMKTHSNPLIAFFQLNGKWIYPSAALAIGLSAGVSAGQRFAARSSDLPDPVQAPIQENPAPEPPTAPDITAEDLAAINAADFEALRIISEVDPEFSDAKDLLEEFQRALDANDRDRVAQLGIRIADARDTWLAQTLAAVIASDSRNPISEDARAAMRPGALDDPEKFLQWNRQWFEYIHQLAHGANR